MKKLEIEQTYKFPKVLFDPFSNTYEVSGNSIPEHSINSYAPLFKWLDENINEIVHENIEFNFKLNYLNSSSVRTLYMFFNKLEAYNRQKKLSVNWFCDSCNQEFDTGKFYKEILNIPFYLIPNS